MSVVLYNGTMANKIMAEKLPCTNCNQALQCDVERKACIDFLHYVNSGRFAPMTERVPSRLTYNVIFWEEQ